MSITIQRPINDNRPGVAAEFVRIPEAFLKVYSQELLDWAAGLETKGQFLEVMLWNPPGATSVLAAGYQGKVKLRCDVTVNPTTKAVRLVIQPDDEAAAARVAKHCEDLPGIMRAHRAAAEANRDKPRGAVSAVFNLPEYFVARYSYELREWGRNLKKIGLVKTIVLREGTLSDLSPDPEIGAVLLGVKLQAKIERMDNGVDLRFVLRDERPTSPTPQSARASFSAMRERLLALPLRADHQTPREAQEKTRRRRPSDRLAR